MYNNQKQDVPHLIDKIFEKPARGIGNTLDDIWYIVLGGRIENYAKKQRLKYYKDLEIYRNEIIRELEKIDSSNRCTEVDMQIIGSALEASKFCIEKEELRNMFAKLIASSLDNDKIENVQPAFASIINQLSSTQALLLKFLWKYYSQYTNRFPIVDVRMIESYQLQISEQGSNKILEVNDMDVNLVKTAQSNNELVFGKTVYSNIIHIDENIFPGIKLNQISSCLANIERLKIIEIRDKQIFSNDESFYDDIVNSSILKDCLRYNIYNRRGEKNYYCLIKKYFYFTDFGIAFLKTCI